MKEKSNINDKIKQYCPGCYYNNQGECAYGTEYAGTVHPRRCEAEVRN